MKRYPNILYTQTCAFSGIPIRENDEVIVLPLICTSPQQTEHPKLLPTEPYKRCRESWVLLTFPIEAKYDGAGGIRNLVVSEFAQAQLENTRFFSFPNVEMPRCTDFEVYAYPSATGQEWYAKYARLTDDWEIKTCSLGLCSTLMVHKQVYQWIVAKGKEIRRKIDLDVPDFKNFLEIWNSEGSEISPYNFNVLRDDRRGISIQPIYQKPSYDPLKYFEILCELLYLFDGLNLLKKDFIGYIPYPLIDEYPDIESISALTEFLELSKQLNITNYGKNMGDRKP